MANEDTVCAARYMLYNVRKTSGATLDSTSTRRDDPQSMKGQFSRHEARNFAKRLMGGQF